MISVLYVDDEPSLLDVAKLFLERDGQFSVDTITTAPAALSLMKSKIYDAIISDYQMPDMDGIKFLKQVRGSGNTIPFVLFTGRGREEIVIQALNEGADFYLQKGGDLTPQFTELSHQIRQAVQRRRAEASIRDHERLEQEIINFLPDATIAIDTKGIVIAWNRAVEEMTGIPASRMLGKGDYEYALPFYGGRRPILIDMIFSPSDDIGKRYTNIVRDGTMLSAETTLARLRGEPSTLWFKASPLYDQNGKVVGAIESIRDITDRKAVERALNESEQRYRNVVEDQTEFISRFQPDGTHVFVNEAYCRYFGLKRDVILGHRFRPKIPAEDQKRVKWFFASLTPDHPVDNIEHRIIMSDGIIRWQRWNDRAIFDKEGHIREYQSVGRDITDQKKAENSLRTSQVILTEAMDLAHLANWEYDDKRGMFIFDDRFYAFYGTTAAREGGYQMPPDVYFREFVHPDDRGRVIEEVERNRTRSDPHYVSQLEHRIIRRDGEIRYVVVRSERTTDNDEHVIKIHGVNQDITERKRAKEALSETEKQYRILFENANDAMFLHEILPNGLPGKYIMVNDVACNRLGYSRDELLELSPIEIASPKHVPRIEGISQKTERDGHATFESIHRRKDGTELLVEINTIRFEMKGRPVALAIARDITERKRTEEALRESEKKYRTLLESLQDSIIVHRDTTILYLNPACEKVLGYSRESLLGRSIMLLVPPEFHEAVSSAVRKRMAGEKFEPYEIDLMKDDGSRISVIMSGNLIEFEGVPASVNLITDITESKRTQEALKESEERYRLTNRKLALMTDVTYQDIQNKITAAMGFLGLNNQSANEQDGISFNEKAMETLATIQTLIAKTKDYQMIGMDQICWESPEKTIHLQFDLLSMTQGVSLDCNLTGLEIYADPLIDRVFYFLMHNSIQHGKTTTRISFSYQETSEGLMLVYEDNGIGIFPEIKPHIFERFAGGGGKFDLFFIREFLSLSDMKITETGIPGKGARFEITVPKGAYRRNTGNGTDASL